MGRYTRLPIAIFHEHSNIYFNIPWIDQCLFQLSTIVIEYRKYIIAIASNCPHTLFVRHRHWPNDQIPRSHCSYCSRRPTTTVGHAPIIHASMQHLGMLCCFSHTCKIMLQPLQAITLIIISKLDKFTAGIVGADKRLITLNFNIVDYPCHSSKPKLVKYAMQNVGIQGSFIFSPPSHHSKSASCLPPVCLVRTMVRVLFVIFYTLKQILKYINMLIITGRW